MRITGAIFDLDGTLLDSMPVWDTLGNDYLLSRGICARENLSETFRQMTLEEAAQYYRQKYQLKDSIEEIVRGVNKLVDEFYLYKARLKPGAEKLLTKLKEKGVKICLTTASDRFLAESALRRNGVLSFFSELFTCSQVGKGKENPRIYRHALYYLNTEKDSTWVFEDAFHAVRTAKKDGFPVVGVYDPSEENNQQAIRELSDIYLRELTEMEEYF